MLKIGLNNYYAVISIICYNKGIVVAVTKEINMTKLPTIIPGKPVRAFEIGRVEHNLHIKLPLELKEFYAKYGAAQVILDETQPDVVNQVLSPFEIMDVLKHQGKHRYVHNFAQYAHMRKHRVPFFETTPNDFLTIGYLNSNKGNIYENDNKIANSLHELLALNQKQAVAQ